MMDGIVIAVGVLLFLVGLALIAWKRLDQESSREYYARFVEPQIKQAREKGIPQDTLEQMWAQAIREASPTIVGRAPGSILRDLIDEWEPSEKE